MNGIHRIQGILAKIREINSEPNFHEGISAAEIEAYFGQIGQSPSPEILQLYALHNGIDYLNAFLYFFEMKDAIAAYKLLQQCKEEDTSFKWQPTWFPILTENGDIIVCLDMETKQLAAVDLEGGSEEIITEHYLNYLDAISEVFESGSYEFSERSGCIEFEPQAWQAALKKHGVKEIWV